MSNYQKTNPTKGTKTTSSSTSPKLEHSGPVLSDSLAASSLRSNGSFSKGNPAGILSAMSANTTLNRGDDTIGVRRVHPGEDGGGHVGVARIDTKEEEKYETEGTGKGFVNPHYGQNWDGEDVDWDEVAGRKKKEKKEDEGGFGEGVNVVDKQPEIGSDEDPGRYAEKKFLERNAREPGVPEGGSGEGRGENPYDVLKDKSL
ncbi:uncharacterized protein DFL_009376 [Arthrobotrys flagrans]|uniref:Uncharacterized protein n=1 Tax=Arthrobotrys flagrans TaxID=97331 RepID=A0A436ZRS4_ARTFL|nr:hypothetical protein DFL_009376 [Arthrobotrys flagrans]